MKKEIGLLNTKPGNWVTSKWMDLGVFLIPVWVMWAVFLLFQDGLSSLDLPLWAWVVFILGLDVSHVWSSLFRTYLDKEEFQAQKRMLILAPIAALLLSILLLYFGPWLFWRIMAYLAVFHFIKQQYGFVALYKVRAKERYKGVISDKLIVYIATVYPLIFWHFNSDSNINWFVENDFFQLHQFLPETAIQTGFSILNMLYWFIILWWILAQIRAKRAGNTISNGKLFWIGTTAINWWFGIIYFNSDLVFSISNVVAHGLPYLGLIYFYGNGRATLRQGKTPMVSKRLKWLGVLIATVLVFALIEEYFWDMLVYRDHSVFFETIYPYRWNQLMDTWPVIIAIAFLALPQQVHYIADGFIWKMNAKNKYLKPIFIPES